MTDGYKLVPKIGRMVDFWPGPSEAIGGNDPPMHRNGVDQPMSARIVYVWGAEMVNVVVTDHVGRSFQRPSIRLLDITRQNMRMPVATSVCTWVPSARDTRSEMDDFGNTKPAALEPAVGVTQHNNAFARALLANAIAMQRATLPMSEANITRARALIAHVEAMVRSHTTTHGATQ